jgi:hypothetical protein
MINRKCQCISISEEYFIGVRIHVGKGFNLLLYLIEWTYCIAFGFIHGAKAASVVTASECGLDDNVIGFSRGTVEREGIINHGMIVTFNCLSFTFTMAPRSFFILLLYKKRI